MFCIAHTPVEAERGNTRGKRAKRRLDVIICQLKALKGKHMSETDTMSDSKVLGHLGWVGRNCFHDKDENFVWGKKRMAISAVLKALLE